MIIQELTTSESVAEVVSDLNLIGEPVVVDVETTGLDTFKDRITECQLCPLGSDSVYVFGSQNLDQLSRLTTRVVGHNFKFDFAILTRIGIDVAYWKYRDTLLMGHLLDENRLSYSLGSYVKDIWGDSYKEEFWLRHKSYTEAPRAEQLEYACKDVWYTGRLYQLMTADLAREGIPPQLVEDVHRLQYALLRTEISGVRVDRKYLVRMGAELGAKIDALLPKLRDSVAQEVDFIELENWGLELDSFKTDKRKSAVARPVFSFDSSPQLKRLLYGVLELPTQYNEKTKAVSTDWESLEKLKGAHPVVPLIQEYRELVKVKGTYIDGIADRAREGRIYPTFRLVDDESGMKTARISHRDPNLGNFPKSGEVKGIFIPDDGRVLAEFDYGMLEVCIEAHFTQDKNLLRIIMEGASKHDITAQSLGIERQLAKTLNFAMQYFCGPGKVASIMGVSDSEGAHVFNKYWETYAGCRAYKAKIDALVKRGEPVIDLFGRKRRFKEVPRWEGDKAFRQAYNFVIQSTGAQILNNAYYRCDEGLRKERLGSGLWTVHDSGLFQLKEATAQESAKRVERCMIQEGVLCRLTVPLTVDSKVGMTRWGEDVPA
jgi:DNA polymerase I